MKMDTLLSAIKIAYTLQLNAKQVVDTAAEWAILSFPGISNLRTIHSHVEPLRHLLDHNTKHLQTDFNRTLYKHSATLVEVDNCVWQKVCFEYVILKCSRLVIEQT